MASTHWAENGDLIATEGLRFRRIGWQINGGPNDKLVVEEITEEHKAVPMGGFTPVYVEVGD